MEFPDISTPAFGPGFWRRALLSSVGAGLSIFTITYYIIHFFFEDADKLLIRRIGLIALLAPMFITLAIFWTQRYLKSGQAKTFFGAGQGKPPYKLHIVVSSYRHVQPYDADKHTRYFKPDTKEAGGKRFVRGARDSVVGAGTMRSAVSTLEQAQKNLVGYDIQLDADTDVMEHGAPPPDTTYVCLGSPGTNDVSRYIWQDSKLNTGNLYTFDEHGNLVQKDIPRPLKATGETDYAALVKFSGYGSVYFLCAGVDEEGTVTAANWLFDHWVALKRETRSLDFYQILQVDKAQSPLPAAAKPIGIRATRKNHDSFFS